jgi:hypothetical protein
MDGESRRQQLRSVVGAWRRVRLAAWITAMGVALSSVTVVLSALNAISTQLAIGMALPAGLITIGGIAGWIVPDAWIAWRRGFGHGCKAALNSQAYVLLGENAGTNRTRSATQKQPLFPRSQTALYADEHRANGPALNAVHLRLRVLEPDHRPSADRG